MQIFIPYALLLFYSLEGIFFYKHWILFCVSNLFCIGSVRHNNATTDRRSHFCLYNISKNCRFLSAARKSFACVRFDSFHKHIDWYLLFLLQKRSNFSVRKICNCRNSRIKETFLSLRWYFMIVRYNFVVLCETK